jgi:hypothetical protein
MFTVMNALAIRRYLGLSFSLEYLAAAHRAFDHGPRCSLLARLG